jgi:hypothetical protein
MHLTLGSFKGLRFAGTLVLLSAAVVLGLVYGNSVQTRVVQPLSNRGRHVPIDDALVRGGVESVLAHKAGRTRLCDACATTSANRRRFATAS